MTYTIDTSLAATPRNNAVTLLSLGTQSASGKVTSNTLQFGAGNAINFNVTSGVFHGSTAGVAATPYGEAGNFMAVEPGIGIVISYASAQKYFGILWGSVDAGNTIQFYNGLNLVGTVTGRDISSNPNGSQGADGSYYANINFTDTSYTRVVLTTPTPAFEFNTIASAPVVVPVAAGQTGTVNVVTATDPLTGRTIGHESAPAVLGGTVFLDANADGVKAGSDAAVAGVTVRLLNAAGAVASTDVTDANGLYQFNGVAAGNYTVSVVPPSGDRFSPVAAAAAGSKVDATGAAAVTVAAGSSNTVNAGVYVPARVGGVAFVDSNGNGVQDAGDGVLAGATVQLLNEAGASVASATTTASGAYSFAGVTPGNYQVAFAAPAGAVFTARDAGGNDAIDSDVGANGRTAGFSLASGGSVTNLSAGVYTPVGISGTAFTDRNADGVQGPGDSVLAGVAVQLLDGNGAVLASTVTAASGAYSFAARPPGTYQLAFDAPAGTVFTTRDAGGNDALDSDVGANGRTAALVLASGGGAANVSAGVYTPGSIGGVAFLDSNANGVQSSGDALLPGVAVQLLDAGGGVLASTVTSATGAYGFVNLRPGSYQVAFATPAGAVVTARDAGGNDAADSDIGADGRSAGFVLESGAAIGNLSAGFYRPAGVSGVAFTDANGNGMQDAGDSALAGVTVRLLDAGGAVAGTATTAANGAYGFAGLLPGSYEVAFTAPAGMVFTARDQGDDGIDSDVGGDGRSGGFTLTSGASVGNVSAGVYAPGGIGGIAFADSNGNGLRDAGDGVLAGVAVQLLDGGGALLGSTTTSASGAYAFAGVAPGTYQVAFTAPRSTVFTARDQGGDEALDSDVAANGLSGPVTIASGSVVADLSAGLFTPGTARLAGTAWLDANGDGIRGSDEVALAGVAVRLLDAAGQALGPTTVTDATGAYAFAGLSAGSYRAGFAPLIGTAFTRADQGGNEAMDSDVSGPNGVSSLIVRLGNGETDGRGTVGLVLDLRHSPVSAPTVNLGDANNNFPGTAGAEVVHGNGGNDSVHGLGGDDTLYGDAGDDFVNGHAGDDGLDGGDGDDNVQGQEGDDLILGGAGNDIGEGGPGDDVLLGGAGRDNMQGELGDDLLFGGGGDDIMVGNEGDDLLSGGDGNDQLPGGPGRDVVIGGRDDGRLSLDAAGRLGGFVLGDLIEGNEGADAFVYQAGDGVDLMLDFNPGEGDTLTVYGHAGFTTIGRLPDGRMALYLGPDSGIVLNNDIFRDVPAGAPLPGVRFIESMAGAPRDVVAGDVVVPVLARNWLSQFLGGGPIRVSQDFPALDAAVSPQDLSGIAFGSFQQLSGGNDTTALPSGNAWIEAGSGYDIVNVAAGFRGVGHVALPDGSLRLDIGSATGLIRDGEEIRFADGTLHLSPDSHAAQVSRLYDAALGRAPDQNGLNFWIARIDAGAPLLELANGFLASPEFAQRYGNQSNQDYITLLYANVLDRAPDTEGMAFWGAVLAAGTSRSQVLLSFSESPENKAAFTPVTAAGIWDLSETAAQVARLYDTALGRLPEVAGIGYWRDAIESGGLALLDVAGSFVASPEFQAQYGSLSNRAFVERIYRNALDRDGDAGGIDFHTAFLDSGTLSRSDVVLNFSESPEHQAMTQPNVMSEDPGRFGILFAA